jgi:hypothetical protein
MTSHCLCAKIVQQYILFFVIFRPSDMQEYIFMFEVLH